MLVFLPEPLFQRKDRINNISTRMNIYESQIGGVILFNSDKSFPLIMLKLIWLPKGLNINLVEKDLGVFAKLSQAQAEAKASVSAEISFIFDFTSVWAGVHAVWAGVHAVWAGVHTVWAGVHPGKVLKLEIWARCTNTTWFEMDYKLTNHPSPHIPHGVRAEDGGGGLKTIGP